MINEDSDGASSSSRDLSENLAFNEVHSPHQVEQITSVESIQNGFYNQQQ